MNHHMRNFLYICLYVFIILLLIGCSSTKQEIINVNNYLQTNYDYNCLDGTKTFTQIILCYQEQDEAEKTQNEITNDLILKK